MAERLAALPVCPYWADGAHCYETIANVPRDEVLITAALMKATWRKVCACGAEVKAREETKL